MTAIDPTTEETIASVPFHSSNDVQARLVLALKTFAQWRQTPLSHRSDSLRRVADILRQRKTQLSDLMTREMGKLIAAGEAEIEKCALACEFFADHAPAWLEAKPIASDAARSYVRYDPLGPVLAIMPWNFPYWQFFRFAAPALMAGNVAVLKHAPNVPGCANAIERAFLDAGFPPGVVVNVHVDNSAAENLIRHPAIAAVTLTGSERAGKAVASAAASVLKKSVLELGGSDPFIVMPDAHSGTAVDAVAKFAVDARCINSGQSCIAAKRFIVIGDANAARAFANKMADIMRSLTVGNPADPSTQIGPLARLDLLEHLYDQVQRSVAAGAALLCGGHRLPQRGYFFSPTVLADVTPGMPAFDEETFGPVAAVIAANDTDDALRLANLSRYGLGASIWTSNPANAEALAPRIESGNVFINGAVKSDPRLPFGGIKSSGWGRELSTQGLHEFTNVKTVWIAK
jgi:succinate-semialdehyde dehydrogenase/glutarate-semialdehyde dehydrogenase